MYVKKVNDTSGLVKTLKGFKRTEIAAGKTINAVITLPYNAFEFYDDKSLQMDVMPGEYEIWYGGSSNANDLKVDKIIIQ